MEGEMGFFLLWLFCLFEKRSIPFIEILEPENVPDQGIQISISDRSISTRIRDDDKPIEIVNLNEVSEHFSRVPKDQIDALLKLSSTNGHEKDAKFISVVALFFRDIVRHKVQLSIPGTFLLILWKLGL